MTQPNINHPKIDQPASGLSQQGFTLVSMCIIAFLFSQLLFAQELDGAKILEIEALRAQEITRLEHQAKIAEHQARIAQAEKRLREAGGLTLHESAPLPDSQPEPVVKPRLTVIDQAFEIPRLRSVDGNTAVLETQQYGPMLVQPGMRLPQGFTVVTIDANRGVSMRRNGITYIAQYQWQ